MRIFRALVIRARHVGPVTQRRFEVLANSDFFFRLHKEGVIGFPDHHRLFLNCSK